MKRRPSVISRLDKTKTLLALFTVSIFLTVASLSVILPGRSQAAPLDSLFQLPESTPGNFTVTWYSAKRYIPGQGPGTTAGHIFTKMQSPVDKARSDAALQSYNKSVLLKSTDIPDLTFNMDWWQPDTEYWGGLFDFSGSKYNWNWAEVEGFIKVPDYVPPDINPVLMSTESITIGINPLQRSDVTYDLEIDSNGHLKGGDIVPFRLRIKCYEPDQSKLNTGFSISFYYQFPYIKLVGSGYVHDTIRANIPPGNLYQTLALKDMRPFMQLDPQAYTLTLDPKYRTLRLGGLEYGIAGGTDFRPLSFGTNRIDPLGGDVIVRYQGLLTHLYITIGAVKPAAEGVLLITRRTPGTTELAWTAPDQGTVSTYDIYRQRVATMGGFSHSTTHAVEYTARMIGSTSGLTFTDQGLRHNEIYLYQVKANLSTGYSHASNGVRTDSVAMEGLPSTPEGLRSDPVVQDLQCELTLSWDASTSPAGIKEYIIYRKIIPGVPGELIFNVPREIARTPDPSYIDRGLRLTDIGEYSVQAVDNNGVTSYISATLNASFERFIPPTEPEGLRAGAVLRREGFSSLLLQSMPWLSTSTGYSMSFDFSQAPGSSVLMGPHRQIALRWEPSSDNVGIAGYEIYRVAKGELPGQQSLAGTTKETFFVDSGLEFGRVYDYYVVARDTDGNTAASQISVSTRKYSLAGLDISDGSQLLNPEPAFIYFQHQYTLNVANEVKSIILTPEKTSSQSVVEVNGGEVRGNGGIPVVLDPGENTVLIEVLPPRSQPVERLPISHLPANPGPTSPSAASPPWSTVRYTLTVDRANLDTLPALTLPESGTVLDEGSTYQAAGRIVDIPDDQVWAGAVDYGDGSGEKSLPLNADGSFMLEHKYLDDGQYKISVSFRYEDLGLVKDSLEVTVQNVAPSLADPGIADEFTTQEGSPLTIEGSIADPGQDTWTVTADYGSEWGPVRGTVNEDKTFTLQCYFYDYQPEHDMVLKITDGDGGVFSKNIKIKVENVAPTVQAGNSTMIQRGTAFTRAGSFADPGMDQWRATVDFGDGSGEQNLALKNNKTFELNHYYLIPGTYTVTVRVEDQDGGVGSASFEVKAKEFLFTLEAGADTSLREGETLKRDVPVQGWSNRVNSITVDYGDGTGESAIAWSTRPSIQPEHGRNLDSQSGAVLVERRSTGIAEEGWLPLQHTYADDGTYTVEIKLVDAEGDSYEDSFQAEVANVPPTVQLEPIWNMFIGSTFTGRGSFTDPGADTWTVEIDFKDGSEPGEASLNPDKTFSFSYSYRASGTYNIEAVVRDDDGGIGRGSQRVTVLRPSSGGGSSISHDASLHSIVGLDGLTQNDGFYLGDGFIPDCLEYTCAGTVEQYITVTAHHGATITLTIIDEYGEEGSVKDLPQNTPFDDFDLSPESTLKITVTAQDGLTTREYTFEYI